MLNNVRIAAIHLASLVYLLVYVSTYCVPIAFFASKQAVSITLFGPRPNNKILIWIVFFVLGTIRDLKKTNCTKNYKGLFQPLSANSALQAKICKHVVLSVLR